MIAPTFNYLTDVYFGPGVAELAPRLLAERGCARPLVVSDAGVMNLLPLLGLNPSAVFSDVPSNPTEASVLAGLSAYRAGGCDCVVALGGGSPMDCAKAVALLASHPLPLDQYAILNGGMGRITAAKPPVFAVPTTAGTGSEVGRGALVTFNDGRKLALISPHLIPRAAICDPRLTAGMPPWLTAATGLDAISHCVETYCSPRFNPVAEAIALDGLARACANIGRAFAEGADIEARSQMLMAAVEGGLTFQKGLGAVHSLSHALGSLSHRKLHHGMLNAILLPHVLRFNSPACAEKVLRIGRIVGADDPAGFFQELSARLGLPARLRDMGVTAGEVESIIEHAHRDHCTATNPRPMTVDDCRSLAEAAF